VENLEKLKLLTLKLEKCGARNVPTKKRRNRKGGGGRNRKMKNTRNKFGFGIKN
jgi:hypothetical protein